jgi:antitoxin component YwqK of YwqJK toxin-antitoxin module
MKYGGIYFFMNENTPSDADNDTENNHKKDNIKKNIDIGEELVDVIEEDPFASITTTIQDGLHILDNNDSTTTSVTYKDGKKNGPCQVLQGEKILMEMMFVEDLLSGAFKYFFANKAIQTLMNYANGELHGEFIQYYPDGKSIQMKTSYEKGLQHGLSQSFDQDGNLIQEMTFLEGTLNGPMNTYHNGELIARTYYKDGAEVMQKKN